MSELNKIEEKELSKVVEQQQKLNDILTKIGVLETQKHSLLHQVATLNKEIDETKKDLEGKYGQVNINLEDGTYTKIESEDETDLSVVKGED
jgi:peptidoglycan hydrolase CwlO-like protein|tara:strand:+ start:68 stop:343 length:276 start_codon:yes stop_codon:yes gene_type:complete